MSKNKLLFIVNVDWFFISHRLPIAIEAKRDGYMVFIACHFTKHKEELIKMGFNTIDIPFSRSGGGVINELKTLKYIRSLIYDVEPSLIHAVTIKPVLYTGLILRTINKDIPFVAAISGLGYVFVADNFRARITKFIASIFYKLALSQSRMKVVFQNTSDENILTDVANLKRSDKVLIKGSGADLSVFNYNPENIRQNITVVMACRLLKEKGVYEYINAAISVKKDYPDVEFLLVGTPDLDNPNTVSQYEIDEWVDLGIINYLGHRSDISNVFSNSNIVCLPSFYGEGVPKVLIEAAACGRAIITTDNPGCRDAVIQGVTGFHVPIKDSVALAKAIINLIKDPDLRLMMGSSARLFAEKEFDVRSVVNKHLDIYRQLVS